MATKGAFNQVVSYTINNQALYDLGLITNGTDKVYTIKVPSIQQSGQNSATPLKAILTGFVNTLEGAGVLTITARNLTSGGGVTIVSTVDTADDFFETNPINCLASDLIEYTFSYAASDTQKATFNSYNNIYIK